MSDHEPTADTTDATTAPSDGDHDASGGTPVPPNDPRPKGDAPPDDHDALGARDLAPNDGQPKGDEPSGDLDLDADLEPGDTFERSYVERLRGEAARYRQRAQAAEAEVEVESLRGREFERMAVEHGGRLADPADLVRYVGRDDLTDDQGRADPERIAAAVDRLVEQRPHLRRKRFEGSADQGARRGASATTPSLSDALRRRGR